MSALPTFSEDHIFAWREIDDGASVEPIRGLDNYTRWIQATGGERWSVQAKRDDACLISTVFLRFDHNWSDTGQPVLYETMIFWPGFEFDEWQQRYRTRQDAIAGHNEAVAMVDAWIERHSQQSS